MTNVYYLPVDGAELFTVVCLPEGSGKYPTVIYRSPYMDQLRKMTDEEAADDRAAFCKHFTDAGYAVVHQNCRGRGKSSGDCIPYVNERADGLALQDWVRKQDFYNGEIYLCGRSYYTTVHYVTAPFADDIKGAVFCIMDCVRYNVLYRNGFFKMGLHGDWYVNKMYKTRTMPRKSKNYVKESFNMLPLSDFTKTVFGEHAEDFDESLKHPDRNDPFWDTHLGGVETRDAVKHANIPILFTTGLYDIFTGGVFDMWNDLDAETKAKSALLVHPYNHGDHPEKEPLQFENGLLKEQFGDIFVKWLDYVRGKGEAFVETGKVTYYQLFGNRWLTDDFRQPQKSRDFVLGEGERTYVYNPYAPASFPGGLSANFGGNAWQDEPDSRYDILSFFTPEFTEDTYIKGKMQAKLTVRSDCEDTCFYMRLSLVKEEGYYGLRDDINQISNFKKDYQPGTELEMDFTFDEHAFIVKKGEKLRVDISSSAFPHYVRHTNNRGLFSEQTTAKIAHNTVILDKSYLRWFYE